MPPGFSPPFEPPPSSSRSPRGSSQAANEAVTAPNSSITSIDVLQNYINNQINTTITNQLDAIWVNATALLWKAPAAASGTRTSHAVSFHARK